jgi:hypothetical protein
LTLDDGPREQHAKRHAFRFSCELAMALGWTHPRVAGMSRPNTLHYFSAPWIMKEGFTYFWRSSYRQPARFEICES